MVRMSEKKPTGSLPTDNWEDKDILQCKTALLKHYDSLSNSQAVRIIGFIAGLLTLLQTVQTLGRGEIASIFPNLAVCNISYTPFELFLMDCFKLSFFLIVIFGLFFYIFRAFFKFSLFSLYSNQLRWVKKRDIEALEKSEKLKEKDLMILIPWATSKIITGELERNGKKGPRLTLYKFFKYDWFISGREETIWGYLLCIVFSLISTLFLLFLLW
jgi:hypothetical protein